MEPARGEARWLVLDDAHVPALGSEADSFDYGGQDRGRWRGAGAGRHGSVTISAATKATGTSRNTVKDHIKALTEKGHLARHGAGRGTWYSLA